MTNHIILDCLKNDNVGRLRLYCEENVNYVYYNEDEEFDDEPILHIALRIARDTGRSKCAKWLIENGANVNDKCHWGCTPFLHLITKEKVHIGVILNSMRLLIKKGVDINKEFYDEKPLLYHVINYESDPRILSLLIEKGADINWVDNHGNSLLHHAAGKGLKEHYDLLITSGANPEAVNNYGVTVKHSENMANFTSALSSLVDSLLGKR